MSINFKISLLAVTLLSLLIVAQVRIENKLTVSELEIQKSCEAGVLFYVLAYKENLPLRTKRQQMHDMSMECRRYTDVYKKSR